MMFLDLIHCLMFLEETTFPKLVLFPSSGKILVARTLLSPLERANLNHWTLVQRLPLFHVKTETDPVSET
jgi:hypothetical protein